MPGSRAIALVGLFVLSCASDARESPAQGDGAEAEGCALPNCSDDASSADLGVSSPDPRRLIRFDTADGAAERRSKLLAFLWPTATVPDTKPEVIVDVGWPTPLRNIDRTSVSRVDRLDAFVTGTNVRALSYVLRPSKPAEDGEHVVIIHQGHISVFDAGGLGRAASLLLQRGFVVVAMHMPLFGWNYRNVDGLGFHGKLFESARTEDLGRVFRFFVEPVVQNVNHFAGARDVAMIGLSGGGWAATFAAAVDPRIRVSMEVAGSAPLYARETKADIGDREQHEPTVFGEDIAADGTGGGIATWLEIYVLAGHGSGRHSFQVNNEFDPCCFRGGIADTYAPLVAERVRAIGGGGEWSNVVDRGATTHAISEHVLVDVFAPALSSVAR